MFSKLTVAFMAVTMALVQVNAEMHTVIFVNKCGSGTPYLKSENGQVLSTGGAYTIDGPLISAIAYLQTGGCGDEGENCTVIETTLKNGASSTEIFLVPPYEFSVVSGFAYYDGCDGAGADCTSADCPIAFQTPDQPWKQVNCTADNENLAITFCD